MDMMEAQSISRKAELRDKIRALEAERNNLETEIILLKEKVEVKELEAYTASLENEVGTLRVEKTILEERATLTPYVFGEGDVDNAHSSSPASISSSEAPGTSEEFPELTQSDGIVQPISNDAVVEPRTDSVE